ncbi:MAG: isocitrate lyase/PEP mutase family protein [Candidatus Lambdaproteobacteria bacterium]|nr:isocitrate lyase/PEP mutase family protein [Candidatus Lambdaproteobacteria bacterium]
MSTLRDLLAGAEPVCAPLVLNPLMARLAESAGHRALYLGGGATGYAKVVLEANLNVTDMVQAGLEIRAVCDLPLILDAAAGWGDPMHMHRTIGMAEAAGFAAIEIEDQLLPKRAHHHVGIEHMVPAELMAHKVREALAARRGDMLIIARTNGVRASSMDDALRRAEAYRAAGADVVLISPRTADEARHIGERLAPPLMHLYGAGAQATSGMAPRELFALGFRILVDAVTPLFVAYEAMAAYYRALAPGFAVPGRTAASWKGVEEDLHRTIGLARLLAIEKATVEREP